MHRTAIHMLSTLVLLIGAQESLATTLTIVPNAGFSIAWTGTEGQFINGPVPSTGNIARSSNGATAFANGALGLPHTIPNLNNGVYGNSNSWISSATPTPPFAGVDFAGDSLYLIDSIAWSRSNVTGGDPCLGGVCMDRNLDTYTLQFTLVLNPTAATTVTGNRNTGWESIGTITYGVGAGALSFGWQRHEYALLELGAPIIATGFRIQTVIPAEVAIDELEINGQQFVVPEPSTLMLVGLGAIGLGIRRRRRSAC